MAEFRVAIEGTITARNLDSAQKKLADLKQRIAGKVEASEVRLVGQPETKLPPKDDRATTPPSVPPDPSRAGVNFPAPARTQLATQPEVH